MLTIYFNFSDFFESNWLDSKWKELISIEIGLNEAHSNRLNYNYNGVKNHVPFTFIHFFSNKFSHIISRLCQFSFQKIANISDYIHSFFSLCSKKKKSFSWNSDIISTASPTSLISLCNLLFCITHYLFLLFTLRHCIYFTFSFNEKEISIALYKFY